MIDKLGRLAKDLRVSVTDKCNFRCHYCMPEEMFGHLYKFLPKDDILSFEEITHVVRLFARLGVSKVRLTGGEPLLRQSLDTLVRKISQTRGISDLALTTNGYLLAEQAASLKQAGLDRVTVSLDTLNKVRFREMAGRALHLEQVLQGIEVARQCGLGPIKINTVIQKGVNDDEVLDLVRFAREHGYIIRFIEFMDVGTVNGWRLEDVVSANELITQIAARFPLRPLAKNQRSEVANRFQYEGGGGELGFIASVSQPFCGACSRVRLSADGKLFTCLFAGNGFDLRERLRNGSSDDEIMEFLSDIWGQREDRYSELRALETETRQTKRVEMYQIGG